MKLNLILAVDEKNWLWKDWVLAWNIGEDLKYFAKVTSETRDLAKLNAVIMWRKTWDSIPRKFKPLKNRINCILTKTIHTNDTHSKIDDFVLYFNSLQKCLEELKTKENLEEVYIIWGASLYNELAKNDMVERIYLTRIKWDFACDTFFNWVPDDFILESESEEKHSGDYSYKFLVYRKEK